MELFRLALSEASCKCKLQHDDAWLPYVLDVKEILPSLTKNSSFEEQFRSFKHYHDQEKHNYEAGRCIRPLMPTSAACEEASALLSGLQPDWAADIQAEELKQACPPQFLKSASCTLLSKAIKFIGMAKDQCSCSSEWCGFPHLFLHLSGFRLVVMHNTRVYLNIVRMLVNACSQPCL